MPAADALPARGRATQRPPTPTARRIGPAPPTLPLAHTPQPGADLRHPGAGPRQPDGAHRRAARGRRAGPHVQPAVHLRRRRPGQDPPDARGGQRAAGRQARRAQCSTSTPSSSSRDVVKNYQRKTFDELKAKYHSLDLLLIDDVQFFAGKDRTQEEFFNAFEALLAKKRAHHHDQRHLPEGAGRHRRAPDLALRLRPDGRDRAARARDARRDPDQQGARRRRRDARGRGLLRRQERARQRARARRRAAQDPGLLALQPEGDHHRSWRARR